MLRRRMSVVAGWMNAASVLALRLAPRRLVAATAGRMMADP
jgi:hypothetical protein